MVGGLFGSSHSRTSGRGDDPSHSPSRQSVRTTQTGNKSSKSKRGTVPPLPPVVGASTSGGDGTNINRSGSNAYVPPMPVYVEVDTDLNNVAVQEPPSNLVASMSRLEHILKRSDPVPPAETPKAQAEAKVASSSRESQRQPRTGNRKGGSTTGSQVSSPPANKQRSTPFIKRIPQRPRSPQVSNDRIETKYGRLALSKDSLTAMEGSGSYDSGMGDVSSRDDTMNVSANDLAAGQLLRWKVEAEEGPVCLQLLAFGLALGAIGTTIYPIVTDNSYWNVSALNCAVHTINLCTLILIFELRGSGLKRGRFHVRARVRALASRYFNILRLVWGRGLLYIFAGSMNWSIGHPYCIYSAGGLLVAGLLAIVFGSRASFNLDRLRASVTDEVYLWTKFDAVDDDGDDHIDIDGFASLVWSLGLQISDSYTFRAFSKIDRDSDGKISFDEFQLWWFEGREKSKRWTTTQ
jgi:hypothetical protein